MSQLAEVRLPDIGDYKNVPVVEFLVKPGDVVAVEDPLMTVESDKATMEIPAPFAGTVGEFAVSIGTRVSQGALLLTIDAAAPAAPAPEIRKPEAAPATPPPKAELPAPVKASQAPEPVAGSGGVAVTMETSAGAQVTGLTCLFMVGKDICGQDAPLCIALNIKMIVMSAKWRSEWAGQKSRTLGLGPAI